MATVRERLESIERQHLRPEAAMSEGTRGRERPITPCDIRTEYQRDRDRILHCKSFRRLKHKTQCFIAPEGDHYRTRLTHTLEVSQIARVIARALRLNEDLTEAISLGHDLGHTPFGHMGERTLDRLNSAGGGFSHNQQSLRVVETLEGGEGLNLTFEVRDGILCHTGRRKAITLEGRVVALSDRIAYINHDIDDSLRAGVITAADLPHAAISALGSSHGGRINVMVHDVISYTEKTGDVGMSAEIGGPTDELRRFMFDNVYSASHAKLAEQRANRMLEQLWLSYVNGSAPMPGDFTRLLVGCDVRRVACDCVAGMTDNYAVNAFKALFIPDNTM